MLCKIAETLCFAMHGVCAVIMCYFERDCCFWPGVSWFSLRFLLDPLQWTCLTLHIMSRDSCFYMSSSSTLHSHSHFYQQPKASMRIVCSLHICHCSLPMRISCRTCTCCWSHCPPSVLANVHQTYNVFQTCGSHTWCLLNVMVDILRYLAA